MIPQGAGHIDYALKVQLLEQKNKRLAETPERTEESLQEHEEILVQCLETFGVVQSDRIHDNTVRIGMNYFLFPQNILRTISDIEPYRWSIAHNLVS